MVCKLCGTENPATNKFCGECGALLVPKPSAVSESFPPHPDYEPKAEHFASILEPVETPVVTEPARPIVTEPARPTLAYRREPVVNREPVLDREPVVVETRTTPRDNTPLGFEPEGKHYTTISGPSFLGLTDDSPSEADSAYYLLEDEEKTGSRTGWYVFSFVAIAILAIVGVLEWRAIKTGKLSIPFLSNSSAESPKTADQAATTPPDAAAQPVPNSGVNSSTPQSDQSVPPPDETKPDQLTTDHSNSTAATPAATGPSTSAQAPSPKDAEKTDKPAGEASEEEGAATTEPEKAEPSAGSTPAKSAAASSPAAIERTAKPKPARTESVPEKPDPKTNRMLIAGEKYLYGRGVPRDCNQALTYFRAAAAEDNGPAMSHLGAMYAAGNCVKIDRATAYSWFVRAQEADPGNEWISRNLNMLWRDMSSQERAAVSR